MILKGSARRGATDLALHLSNEVDNEKAYLHSLRGSASDNLYEAFREWELIGEQGKTKNVFYSLSINPDPLQPDFTDKQWERAVTHIEKRLKLTGQPRAIVFHEKVGESDGELRRHAHVVWLRVNTRDFKAISNSHDYYKLKAASKELSKEFGLEWRQEKGKHQSYDLAMSQGQNRDPDTAKDRKATLTKLWQEHDHADQFVRAVGQAGYVIAQGDKRGFVIVDRDGEIHSLARQIAGVKTRDIKTRLGEPESYPSVEQAKAKQELLSKQLQPKPKKVDLTREQKLFAKLRHMARRVDKLRIKRRDKQIADEKETKARHKEEWLWFEKRFQRRTEAISRMRKSREPKGVAKYLRTLIGYEILLKWKHAQQDRERFIQYERDRQLLKEAQAKELARIARGARIIEMQEKREALTLEKFAKRLALTKEKALQQARLEKERRLEKQLALSL